MVKKDEKEEIEANLKKEFKEVREKIKVVRKSCDTILDAAEEALKKLME